MPFEKNDPNINSAGRPEGSTLKDPGSEELGSIIRRMKRACPRAVQMIIDAMDDESIPKKDGLKYCKELFDSYMKALGMEQSLRDKNAPAADNENKKPAAPAVVFTLHQAKQAN